MASLNRGQGLRMLEPTQGLGKTCCNVGLVDQDLRARESAHATRYRRPLPNNVRRLHSGQGRHALCIMYVGVYKFLTLCNSSAGAIKLYMSVACCLSMWPQPPEGKLLTPQIQAMLQAF